MNTRPTLTLPTLLARSLAVLFLAGAALSSPAALAQSKVMRIIVPYAAGGPIDVTARLMAERVKDSLGTVIIENKPGGGGNIGVDAIAKAPPDGLTIGISAVATHAINPWLYSKMPYNAATDFAPITQMVRVPNVLVINADTAQRLNIHTLADLIKYAKANPAKLNYASGGNGSAGHLAGEMFKARPASSRCTSPTTAATPRSWHCSAARWISTSTTSPPPRPTSRPASSRPWR
jgi:tripartite-type tricarboxylate transporter receptor subunit TctC